MSLPAMRSRSCARLRAITLRLRMHASATTLYSQRSRTLRLTCTSISISRTTSCSLAPLPWNSKQPDRSGWGGPATFAGGGAGCALNRLIVLRLQASPEIDSPPQDVFHGPPDITFHPAFGLATQVRPLFISRSDRAPRSSAAFPDRSLARGPDALHHLPGLGGCYRVVRWCRSLAGEHGSGRLAGILLLCSTPV